MNNGKDNLLSNNNKQHKVKLTGNDNIKQVSGNSSSRRGKSSGSSGSKGSTISLGGSTSTATNGNKDYKTTVYSAAEKAKNSRFGIGGAKSVVQSAINNNQITKEEGQTILAALGI